MMINWFVTDQLIANFEMCTTLFILLCIVMYVGLSDYNEDRVNLKLVAVTVTNKS